MPAAATLRRATTLVAAIVLALLAAMAVAPAPPAFADAGHESQFVAHINQERAAAGLPALSVASDLTSAARAHSAVMGNGTNLHHNPNLGGAVGGWQKIGENVGRGMSVGEIHAAFMASPSHAANVRDPAWTEVGVGVVVVDGRIWVTEMFRLPVTAGDQEAADDDASAAGGDAPDAASEPDAAPEPDPEPQPEPEPEPEPDPQPEPEPEPQPEPEPEPQPEPEPEPTIREVVEPPLERDRVTVTLAKLEAAERNLTLEDIIG